MHTQANSFELEGGIVRIRSAVKERILELCREKNITVNRLGAISGAAQSMITNIVSERKNSTTISTIKELCDGFNITTFNFFNCDIFHNLEQELK